MKIDDRFADQALPPGVGGARGHGVRAESWRAYNRSFFDALLVEKLLMLVLVGIIFVVVGFNTHHALRRAVLERREDIAVLKALGFPPRQLQYVFVAEGLVVGLAGAAGGHGARPARHREHQRRARRRGGGGERRAAGRRARSARRRGRGIRRVLADLPSTSWSVPARVLPREAIFVGFLAVFSCTFAAWAASRAVARFRPAEVLRHE